MLNMSSQDWAKHNNQLDRYKVLLYESSQYELSLPKTVKSKKYFDIFENNRRHSSNCLFSFFPKGNVRVSCIDRGISGTTIRMADGVHINDLSSYWSEGGNNLSQQIEIEEPVYVVSQKWGGWNLYHWLHTTLPKLAFTYLQHRNVNDYDFPFKILTNSLVKHFVRECFSILNIPIENVLEFSKCPNYLLKNARFFSLPGFGVNLDYLSASLIRDMFMGCFSKEGTKRKIYIERTTNRRITNQYALLDVISKYGFEIVRPEGLSFREQIKLFSEAEVVIAPHGAGLSNIIFCNPGTKILEIFPPTYVGLCYYLAARSAYLDYYYLVGDGRVDSSTDYWYSNGLADITVNINELKEMLCLMGF